MPSEHELTEMFGVSRISVRAALQKLSILGLVETKQGEGNFVSDPSHEVVARNLLLPALALGKHDLLEILEFRRIFEIENARLSAIRRTDTELANLHAVIERMKESQGDLAQFAIEDFAFHAELANITKNSLILLVAQMTENLLRSHMKEIVAFRGAKDALHYHPRILRAIELQDAEAAAKIMAEHIDFTIKDIAEKYPDKKSN
ncbi:HTH-type transcriptional regulator LutR [Peptococcaceae bacterium CEB3]|nr:HTH-type transcriptional regulator LutR [Peptococcaceae bacterium CEB3]